MQLQDYILSIFEINLKKVKKVDFFRRPFSVLCVIVY